MKKLSLVMLLLTGCELSGARTRVANCDAECEPQEECFRRGGTPAVCAPRSWECMPCPSDAGS